MSKFSLTERINIAFASLEAERLQAHHGYTHAASRSYEEWAYIWSKGDDTAWAHKFGRFRGFDEIWWNSVSKYDVDTYTEFAQILPKYPEIGGMDPRPFMVLSMHTLASSIVEVAEDGMSVRASFYTPGTLTGMMNDDGKPFGMMLWERYGADFVYEDGEWLYVHQHVVPDIGGPFDIVNPARDSFQMAKAGPLPPSPLNDSVKVSDPGPMNYEYTVIQPVQNPTPPPVPYKKLNNSNTYATFPGYDD